jgi:16S rRNA (guanine527-N7)-methyltransferase
MSPEQFASAAGVSRETLAALTRYAELLAKWQTAINLVSASSLGDLWRRHMLDSAQLWRHLPAGAKTLADLGSGAGFPGLVLAIMGFPECHLVESDARKAAFLREAARAAGLGPGRVTIHNERAETLAPLGADVVTARALAPLGDLLELAARHLRPGGVGIFLKGENIDTELTSAKKRWKFELQKYPSISHPSGVVLRIGSIERSAP